MKAAGTSGVTEKGEKVSCCVADCFCIAPANLEEQDLPNRLGECFCCGQPVCRMCSSRRNYLYCGEVKLVRLCNDCQVEIDGNDKRVMARLHRLAGYGRPK